MTPTHSNPLFFGKNQPELAGTGEDQLGDWRVGREQPRFVSLPNGDSSYGPAVAEWAERHLKTLMPWQVLALTGQLTCDDDGDLVFRESLISTSRQCGKSFAICSLIGFVLTDYAALRGRPMNVLSVANRLDRAESLFTILAPILVDKFDAKQMQALGRKSVTLPNGSVWEIRAANKNLHGGSYDVIAVDEVFDVDAEVIDSALRPSQIARKSPLLSMWSTAGDEGSTAMIALREQALSEIDTGISSQLYFAEWSMPQLFNGVPVDPMDERFWGWANPALGTTITVEGLRSVSKKDSFIRAHLNQWQAARGAWLDLGVFDKCLTKIPMPDDGVLSVDSSINDGRFVGVRAAMRDGIAHVKVEFVTETETDMWHEIERVMDNPKTQLLITPTLMLHLPIVLQRRTTQVGYAELTKYTTLVRSMIYEKRVAHHGEILLNEHCARSVLVKTPTGAVLSSQKSPGPIELCRTMVWAVAEVSRPKTAHKPQMVIVQNR